MVQFGATNPLYSSNYTLLTSGIRKAVSLLNIEFFCRTFGLIWRLVQPDRPPRGPFELISRHLLEPLAIAVG